MSPFDHTVLKGMDTSLVSFSADDHGKYEFEIWSRYTRSSFNQLQVGGLVAVENYTQSESRTKHYSILTLTDVYPEHYAANSSEGSFPGHVFESMRSIKSDWESQEDEPMYQTTLIRISAVGTGLQFRHDTNSSDLPKTKTDSSMPMIGAPIKPLSNEMVNQVINQEMADDEGKTPLTHKLIEEVNVKLEIDSLLNTHFGIFGFTGVGKSNLVSSMTNYLSSRNGQNPNIVLIDPNDEYIGLLMDFFDKHPERSLYVHASSKSLPKPVMGGLNPDPNKIGKGAARMMTKMLTLPRAIANDDDAMLWMFSKMNVALSRTRIGVDGTLGPELFGAIMRAKEQSQRRQNDLVNALRRLANQWSRDNYDKPISAQNITAALDELEGLGLIATYVQSVPQNQQENFQNIVRSAMSELRKTANDLDDIPSEALISRNQICNLLNEKQGGNLIIIAAKNVEELQDFASRLVEGIYDSRRNSGIFEPNTLFFFDEADLFIPNNAPQTAESAHRVRRACITLARRGRKYGMGLGIATQRSAMLDTQVMGNLHTYFISKLPRKYDRETVSEAFGIGPEQLSATFNFGAGDWLVISHGATGLKGVPIPAHSFDANQRILDYVRESNA